MSPFHRHLGVYGLARDFRGRVLLILKARGPYTGSWDLPGGSPEFGELPQQALLREVPEETGLHVLAYTLLAFFSHTIPATPSDRPLHHLGIVYAITVDPDAPLRATPDGQDATTARWLGPEELQSVPLTPFARQALDEGSGN